MGLQRGKTESALLVPGQNEPDGPAAKIANSVEQDDGYPVGGSRGVIDFGWGIQSQTDAQSGPVDAS